MQGNIMSDLATLFECQEKSRRWMVERENATARLELAEIDRHCAYLISQHEPIASLDINREQLRLVLNYVRHGNMHRLKGEIGHSKKEKSND